MSTSKSSGPLASVEMILQVRAGVSHLVDGKLVADSRKGLIELYRVSSHLLAYVDISC